MFQNFSLRIEFLLGRWRNRNVSVSERIARRRCKTFQARNRLCFDALEFCMLLIPISRLRSAARLETWKEVGTNHCNDCCSEERNTDEPRYEKAVAQKFFGKNDDG
jgi:hypothetical protein